MGLLAAGQDDWGMQGNLMQLTCIRGRPGHAAGSCVLFDPGADVGTVCVVCV